MTSLKLTRIGNSVGVVLPKAVLARLRLGEGDAVYLPESPDGYRLTPYDAEFERQMRAAETVMPENRDVLRPLAKSEAPNQAGCIPGPSNTSTPPRFPSHAPRRVFAPAGERK